MNWKFEETKKQKDLNNNLKVEKLTNYWPLSIMQNLGLNGHTFSTEKYYYDLNELQGSYL
jgi:hypothetical protein